jgi:hypothetical protein
MSPCIGNILKNKRIALDPCTGVDEVKGQNPALTVYPNPAHSAISMALSGLQKTAELTISGSDGRKVYSATIDFSGNPEQKIDLDISNYSNGLYIVRLTQDANTATARFIKQ